MAVMIESLVFQDTTLCSLVNSTNNPEILTSDCLGVSSPLCILELSRLTRVGRLPTRVSLLNFRLHCTRKLGATFSSKMLRHHLLNYMVSHPRRH